MRQQYHFKPSPDGLLAWDVFRLVDLSADLTPYQHPISEISEVDEDWWDLKRNGATVHNVIEHMKLVEATDLKYPIILSHNGGLMDGMHRVCKAILRGNTHILAVRFSEYIEPDYVGKQPDELPYDTVRNDP